MIVVDTSALIAIADREPDWLEHLEVVRSGEPLFLSPINYVETGVVLIGRDRLDGPPELDRWLRSLGVTIKEDAPLAAAALAAYVRFGKGRHPARLNLADCFAYALAMRLDAPLLYKGDDFALTDVRPALQPT